MPQVSKAHRIHPSLVCLFRGISALFLAGTLTSCLAQQADLDRFQKQFEVKLAKMDQQMNKAKQESQTVLDRQKGELKELVKARAQIKSELRSLKEENLTRLSGKLETEAHRLDQINRRADDLSEEIAILGQLLKKQEAEQEAKLSELRKRFEEALVKQQNSVTSQMTDFRGSLQGFKEALAGVDTRLEEEHQRSLAAEASIRKEFEGKQVALQAKLDSDAQTLKEYLEKDVKTSVDSVAKALTEVNTSLGSKIQTQENVASDLQAELATLKSHAETRHQHVEKLTQAVTVLRDVIGKSGTELGGRLDEQEKELNQAGTGLKHLQEQLVALSTKVSADNEALRGYLEKDVRPSIASIAKALDEEKLQTSQDLSQMDAEFQALKQSSDDSLSDMRKLLDAQGAQVQDLGQSVKSFRDVLNTITDQLGKRSDEQLQIVGQLTARMDRLEKDQNTKDDRQQQEAQAFSANLSELTSSIQSTQRGLEEVKNSLSTQLQEQMRTLVDHERRLAAVGPDEQSEQRLDSLRQEVQDNATHLNQVTDSLAQLKDVFNTIGTKLGERVDAHEAQLTTLSQKVQSLTKQ